MLQYAKVVGHLSSLPDQQVSAGNFTLVFYIIQTHKDKTCLYFLLNSYVSALESKYEARLWILLVLYFCLNKCKKHYLFEKVS